jgi:hypothetical protein
MTATNTQQKALAYFSEKWESVETLLKERNSRIEGLLAEQALRLNQHSHKTILAILNIELRTQFNLLELRVQDQYLEALKNIVWVIGTESQFHNAYIENNSVYYYHKSKEFRSIVKRLKDDGYSTIEAQATQRMYELLAQDFATVQKL